MTELWSFLPMYLVLHPTRRKYPKHRVRTSGVDNKMLSTWNSSELAWTVGNLILHSNLSVTRQSSDRLGNLQIARNLSTSYHLLYGHIWNVAKLKLIIAMLVHILDWKRKLKVCSNRSAINLPLLHMVEVSNIHRIWNRSRLTRR